jgi:hypothetical protein
MSVRGLAVLALAATTLAGCGSSGSADDVLGETASAMGKIRSADLRLRLVLEPRENPGSGRVGFALDGPVDLRSGGLPAARLRYTQIAGEKQGGATFVSTGREAFVEVGGGAYRLPRAQAGAVQRSAGAVQLPIERWIRDPKLDDGGAVRGVQTDHVAADLDAVAALRDIFGAARKAGAEVPDLQGAAADQVRDAVKRSSIDVWSGREDRLLRRLRLRIEFEVQPPAAVRGQFGKLAGGRLALDVELGDVNRPVRVEAPANPRPATALAAAGQTP